MNTSDKQIIKNFREILRRFQREIFVQNSASCCCGVTLAQCHTLLEIESKEKESVTELANTLGLDKSTVSRTIEGLVNNGLIDRTIPAENRRMTMLQLTESGKKICKTINSNNDKYLLNILSVLTDNEKEDIIRLLDKITREMMKMRTSGMC